MSNLLPCHGCDRHVRASASTCPFCAATLTPSESETAPSAGVSPTSRSGLLFGVAVGAIAVSTTLFGTGCPMYGGPADPTDASTGNDADDDTDH